MTDLMTIDGKRLDGRTAGQIRDIRIETNVIDSVDGSAYIRWGNNKIYVSVLGPYEAQQRHLQNPHRATVTVSYNMAPFSCDDRKRPGTDRRSIEISKLLSEALSRVIIRDKFPRTLIEVQIDVVESDAGTRCAGLTAASVALADAGIPMFDLVGAVSVGKVENTLVLDPGKTEDNHGQADMPVGMIHSSGEVVLLQMDGEMTMDEYRKGLEMAATAIKGVIRDVQVEALRQSTSVVPFDDDGTGDEGGMY